MSYAELLLRLGCGLVAWLLVYAHGLLLAVVPRSDCSSELGRTTLLFAALAWLAGLLLPAALPWRGPIRWLGLLALPLWMAGVVVALPLLTATSLGGIPLCDALAGVAAPGSAAIWERAWAPLQLGAIALCAIQAARFWRPLPGSSGR